MKESKLFVGSLSYTVIEESLREVFSKYGTIKNIQHYKDKGFAFVEFSSPEEAEKAKTALDETEFSGRKMHIDFAKPKKKY
ncbi:hypothetical protein ES702_00341 [subsurface metagenome]